MVGEYNVARASEQLGYCKGLSVFFVIALSILPSNSVLF